jgi:hypothetical protein
MKSLKLQLSEIQLRVKSLTATPLIVKARMEFPARAMTTKELWSNPKPLHTGVYLSSLAIYPARFQEDQWSLGRNIVNQ